MKWLLDSNVVSEPGREKPDTAVVSWLAARAKSDTAISIVTLAELRDGAASARDEARRERFNRWIDVQIVEYFEDRTLPLNIEVLVDWITLSRRLRKIGRIREPADVLIAATARVHKLILVSRNVRDFAGTGLVVYDPWKDQHHHMELA